MNTISLIKTESADGKRLYYMSIPGVGNIKISRAHAIMGPSGRVYLRDYCDMAYFAAFLRAEIQGD